METFGEGFGRTERVQSDGHVSTSLSTADPEEEGEEDLGESAETRALDAATIALERFKEYLEDCFGRGIDQDEVDSARKVCGIVYDERCLQHEHPTTSHPERPARILSIMKTLEMSGLAKRMQKIEAVPIARTDVLRVHSADHVATLNSLRDEEKRNQMQLELQHESAYANEHSTDSALISAGGVLELVKAVVAGTIKNGIAVVRPPGHHAEQCCVKGFCLINNVAVAAAWATSRTHTIQDHDVCASEAFDSEGMDDDVSRQNFKKYKRTRRNYRPLPAKCRVLIVDFDVHHGNGTQKMFYENPDILFFSVHRYDNGRFYPGGHEGGPMCVGHGAGYGCNINIGWNGGGPGDSEYLAAWQHVLMPAARHFDPDLVIVSAGFDAAEGDPLGGCFLSPSGYGMLIHQLMALANGRVVIALEGGYSLNALAESSLACSAVLLGFPPPRPRAPMRPPSIASLNAIGSTIRAHKSAYWQATQTDEVPFNPVLNWTLAATDPTVFTQPMHGDFMIQPSTAIFESNVAEEEAHEDSAQELQLINALRTSPSSHSVSSTLLPPQDTFAL